MSFGNETLKLGSAASSRLQARTQQSLVFDRPVSYLKKEQEMAIVKWHPYGVRPLREIDDVFGSVPHLPAVAVHAFDQGVTAMAHMA